MNRHKNKSFKKRKGNKCTDEVNNFIHSLDCKIKKGTVLISDEKSSALAIEIANKSFSKRPKVSKVRGVVGMG